MQTKPSNMETIVGMATIGSLISGVAALLVAIFAFFTYDWAGAGVCLGAAGITFALLVNATKAR